MWIAGRDNSENAMIVSVSLDNRGTHLAVTLTIEQVRSALPIKLTLRREDMRGTSPEIQYFFEPSEVTCATNTD